MDSTALQIAHLMRRAGFSCGPEELQQRVQQGLDATISDLVHYENSPGIPDTFDPTTRTDATLTLADIQSFWLNRMIRSPRQLQEKMTLFWHGHFATGLFKVKSTAYMLEQNLTFRANAVSNFRIMLQGVSRDPAMLVWLDNISNTKRAPNENYAREVMELFTMGRGNYSEDDVKAGAHAFTGWQIRNGRFWINIKDHDFSPKTFLGVTGRLNGDEIIDVLVKQPATARFMATKLLTFFATANPDGAWVYKIAQAFSDSDGDIRSTVEAIFRSDEFYAPGVMNGMYKSPAEFAVGAIRETGVTPHLADVGAAMRQMGQDLFNPPTVKGWDAGRSWINTATMLARINFSGALAGYRLGPFSAAGLLRMLQDSGVKTAADAVAMFENRLPGLTLAPETRTPLVDYLNASTSTLRGPFKVSQQSADLKVRNMIRLVLSAPEYQFN